MDDLKSSYESLHDVIEIILDSDDKLDLIKKLEVLCHMLYQSTQSDTVITTIIMRLQGKSLAEIADVVGIARQNVKKQLDNVKNQKILEALGLIAQINKKRTNLQNPIKNEDKHKWDMVSTKSDEYKSYN